MEGEGKITIYHHTDDRYIIIQSFSEWFTEEYYTVDDDGEYLTIRKCYLEIPSRAKKIGSRRRIHIKMDGIPKGNYFFDEDENEDEIKIKYK